VSRIELRLVRRRYDGPVPVDALRGIDLDVESGDFVAIEGPSGGGKSTLLNIIGLLDAPSGGEYFLGGVDVGRVKERTRARWRSDQFAFIFQSFHLLDRRPVVDSVELGLLYRGVPPSERRKLAIAALAQVGLTDVADQTANTLSGGQRQRAAIARAIASNAPIVVADEPTGNLDSENAAAVVAALSNLHRGGATVVLVTHSSEIAQVADRRVRIRDGLAAEDPSDESTSPRATIAPPATHRNFQVPGQASTVRRRDVVTDAIASLMSRAARTFSLIAAVALGVGLAAATIGISATASAQVGDTFDAHLNRDVTVTWYADNDLGGQTTETLALIPARLGDVAGVNAAAVISELTSSTVQVNPTRPGFTPPVFLAEGEFEDAGRFDIAWSPNHGPTLSVGEVLIGDTLSDQLELGPIDAQPTIEVNGRTFRVVGAVNGSPRDPSVLGGIVASPEAFPDTPVSTTRAMILTKAGAAQQVARQVPLVIDPFQPDALEVSAPPDPQQLRGEIESGVAMTLAIVTVIALIGAIGALTNAMMLAVNERRSELGLRRALGAQPKHIVSLIVTESVMVGLIGGVAGLCLGLGSILAITISRQWIPVFDLAIAPAAVVAGMLVGALGGVVASAKASRIQPTDALRA
jgi:macrolide transport system ATP-binding/permease protein